jgi:tryptophanyl-tRNA synthetase
MPQYKDKKNSVEFDLGLLLYPVLMSADIIINDPDVVIVGRDQVPHLELCNDIAKRYNNKSYKYEFGDIDKIMSLSDPSKKMSKSGGEKSILYLFDENYEKKIKSANANEDGLKNLYSIANGIGIFDTFDKNIDLKNSIINKMTETFR